MPKILYLFPDTNLFIQCRPLHELDWSEWKDFDEIHLLVTRPIQDEIDDHKGKGGERLGKRARAASSLLRDVIIGSDGYKFVQEALPRVKLFVRPEIKPDPTLTDRLNYATSRDDQLVGTVHFFSLTNPGSDARVLTHDTGPMATAKMVGVPFVVIPDSWLLPPERAESDKRIRSLEAEIARLKRIEPEFHIICIDMSSNECEKLELELTHFEPMSELEISKLIGRLKERFPIATDFGPRERSERNIKHRPFPFEVKEIFVPSTNNEVEEYCESYKEWLSECESTLRNFHKVLQNENAPPLFTFQASNNGTRPATDTLVTISANGKFEIMPPSDRGDDDDEDRDEVSRDQAAAELPKPPRAPRGKWRMAPSIFEAVGALRSFADLGTPMRRDLSSSIRDYLGPGLRVPRARDANKFYYKPERPEFPVADFSLECKQWRHGTAPENFVCEVSFGEAGIISGTLECRIHAANASEVTFKRVPIRAQVSQAKAFTTAQEQVERLSYSLL